MKTREANRRAVAALTRRLTAKAAAGAVDAKTPRPFAAWRNPAALWPRFGRE